ncbi:MAG TPA: nuclear transport factor 2 family protein [Herpetosiphonaceae bacterium]|nr:nuclear transport factor 2 family protein [Herpetosiphonaceae bacterium]
MSHPNLELIDRFFAAYGNRDLRALQEVLDENAVWTFPGHHALSGTHRGIDALVAFFDAMGRVMASAQPTVEKLVLGVHDQYVVECQQIRTNRADGPNLDQQLCVLWRFANGKIASGCHLAADQDALDAFYATLPLHRPEGI